MFVLHRRLVPRRGALMGAARLAVLAALVCAPCSQAREAVPSLPEPCLAHAAERQADVLALALARTRDRLTAAGTPDAAGAVLRVHEAVRVELLPQAQVGFAVPPGRRTLAEGAHAGLVRFEVPAGGTWRVSLDHPAWVDVVAADGSIIESTDFGGVRECPSLVKVVEFPLEAGVTYRLQLSGGSSAAVGVRVAGPEAGTP